MNTSYKGVFAIKKIIKKRIRGRENTVERRVQQLVEEGFKVVSRGTHQIQGHNVRVQMIEAILSKSVEE